MAHGLNLGLETIESELRRDRSIVPFLVLITDGRANVSLEGKDPVEEAREVARRIKEVGIRSLVIDTEQEFISLGIVQSICAEMGGNYLKLEDLKAGQIVRAIREVG